MYNKCMREHMCRIQGACRSPIKANTEHWKGAEACLLKLEPLPKSCKQVAAAGHQASKSWAHVRLASAEGQASCLEPRDKAWWALIAEQVLAMTADGMQSRAEACSRASVPIGVQDSSPLTVWYMAALSQCATPLKDWQLQTVHTGLQDSDCPRLAPLRALAGR